MVKYSTVSTSLHRIDWDSISNVLKLIFLTLSQTNFSFNNYTTSHILYITMFRRLLSSGFEIYVKETRQKSCFLENLSKPDPKFANENISGTNINKIKPYHQKNKYCSFLPCLPFLLIFMSIAHNNNFKFVFVPCSVSP